MQGGGRRQRHAPRPPAPREPAPPARRGRRACPRRSPRWGGGHRCQWGGRARAPAQPTSRASRPGRPGWGVAQTPGGPSESPGPACVARSLGPPCRCGVTVGGGTERADADTATVEAGEARKGKGVARHWDVQYTRPGLGRPGTSTRRRTSTRARSPPKNHFRFGREIKSCPHSGFVRQQDGTVWIVRDQNVLLFIAVHIFFSQMMLLRSDIISRVNSICQCLKVAPAMPNLWFCLATLPR